VDEKECELDANFTRRFRDSFGVDGNGGNMVIHIKTLAFHLPFLDCFLYVISLRFFEWFKWGQGREGEAYPTRVALSSHANQPPQYKNQVSSQIS
jgi:hypothetical protein